MLLIKLFLICLLFAPSLSFAFCFDEAGKAYGINPTLLKSIAKIESNLNPNATNKNSNGSIDIGIMQINSSWLVALNLDSNKLLSDPCYNVMTGSKILKNCIDKHGYTWEAVGCYNAVSKHKRIDYSWKIYNRLKAEENRQSTGNVAKDAKSSTDNIKLNPQPTPYSSLSFAVRDKAAID